MPKYNQFYYDTDYYGNRAALQFSALPLKATAIDYETVELTFNVPTGSYSEFRIVRSQAGVPQTQEDGALIYVSDGPPPTTLLLDDSQLSSAPLVYGKPVFYRAWVRKTESFYWVPAGDTSTLLPSPHPLKLGKQAVYSYGGTNWRNTTDAPILSNSAIPGVLMTSHERFLNTLPRVITSASNSGADVPTPVYQKNTNPSGATDNSLLPTFLSAMSFTYDEMLTFISLIFPDELNRWLTPTSVLLNSHDLGMTTDVEAVTVPQRRLLRHAVEIYQKKGTAAGVELLVQSLTGYDCDVTVTRNLLLSHEDATFDILNWNANKQQGEPDDLIGNWVSRSSGLRLEVVSTAPTVSTNSEDTPSEPLSLDTVYTAKVTPNATGQKIALGTVSPVTSGIPVSSGNVYTTSFYAQSVGTDISSDALVVGVIWYDRNGVEISTTTSSHASLTTSWTRVISANMAAPTNAQYAALELTFGTTTPIRLDLVQFEQGASATAYQEPRGLVLDVHPSKINYIKNPGFTVDAENWATEGAELTRVTDDGLFGLSPTAGKVTITDVSSPVSVYNALSNPLPVVAGEWFSGSVYVKDFNSSALVSLEIVWLNQADGIVSILDENGDTQQAITQSTPVRVSSGSWKRLTVSGKAPFGIDPVNPSVRAILRVTVVDDGIEGTAFLIDSAQFEAGETASDYFDGTLVDDGSEWAGENGNSTTGNYPARTNRFLRLQNELPFYLGFDTPYYTYTYQGLDRALVGIA